MSNLYVDTSCLVALCFDEPGGRKVGKTLSGARHLFSSNLLEAEFRSALCREGLGEEGASLLMRLSWVLPDRPLSPEIKRVCSAGYVRGADLWHLACALYLATDPGVDLVFATLDLRQREAAKRLGFRVPRWR